jgi:hypothetical protein
MAGLVLERKWTVSKTTLEVEVVMCGIWSAFAVAIRLETLLVGLDQVQE